MKRGREEQKKTVFEHFRAHVQESTKKVIKNNKEVPSRVYRKKTERNAGRAHTVIGITSDEETAFVRCHATKVFQVRKREVILDTSYFSKSTKDSINVGLSLLQRFCGEQETKTKFYYYSVVQRNFVFYLTNAINEDRSFPIGGRDFQGDGRVRFDYVTMEKVCAQSAIHTLALIHRFRETSLSLLNHDVLFIILRLVHSTRDEKVWTEFQQN